MKLKRFEELECWQEAKKLVLLAYEVINKSEKLQKEYRLRDQFASAAISVMSNIAEGFSHQSNKEFMQFLYISKSSASEGQSLLYIISELKYISREIFEKIYQQADKVSQINSGLIRYLNSQRK
jgi:four helix bundle protein